MYIHQQPDWPWLHWRPEELTNRLARVRHLQGRLLGRMEFVDLALQRYAMLQPLTSVVVESSKNKVESLSDKGVRWSIARRLGLDVGVRSTKNRNVEGIVEVMLDATQNYDQPLTDERLCGWHAALLPTGRSKKDEVGISSYRTDTVRVTSNHNGREKIHYKAPRASLVAKEMRTFLDWFNGPSETDSVLKAGQAHLWFVLIHPFESGNGRIAWAIREMALTRSDHSPQRFYSMATEIRKGQAYHDILCRIGKGSTNVTDWMTWFLDCLGRALESAESTIEVMLRKARYWARISEVSVNERQKEVLNRLLCDDEDSVSICKWAKIGKCTKECARQDIDFLEQLGMLTSGAKESKNTWYGLVDSESEGKL